MADQDPTGATPPAPQPTPPSSASSLAEQALKAAQAAVASLQQNAAPAPAADSGQVGNADLEAMFAQAAQESAQSAPDSTQRAAAAATASAPALPTQPFAMPSFDRAPAAELPKGIDLLSDVNLNVKIELGRTRMLVEDVLKLAEGAVVELDKLAGDPVDIYVNERHIARGEVLVLNDNFCVRVNEIIAESSEMAAGGKGAKAK